MWLRLWTECFNEKDKELQAIIALRIAGMCHLHLPCKEGDREDFPHTPTAYDAPKDSFPNLYAPRTLEEVVTVALYTYPRAIVHHGRWLAHNENRIAYERAILTEGGGTVADRTGLAAGRTSRRSIRFRLQSSRRDAGQLVESADKTGFFLLDNPPVANQTTDTETA